MVKGGKPLSFAQSFSSINEKRIRAIVVFVLPLSVEVKFNNFTE